MISQCLSVILLVSAVSCGKHSVGSDLSVQQFSAQPVVQNVGIPSTIGSSLSPTNFDVIPKTIPEYLLSLPRTVNFEPIPQSVPIQYLTITAPGAQSLVAELPSNVPSFGRSSVVSQESPSVSQLVSPAQKIRSQPLPVVNPAPVAAQVQTPVIPSGVSVPRFESNAYSGSQDFGTQGNTGFSTPTKPLNFAPTLPEVNGISQRTEQQIERTQQKPEEVVQQRIENQVIPDSPAVPQQPITQQRIDSMPQPLTQQRIDSVPQPLSQQRIDSVPQPLTQQKIDSVPQPLSQQRIEAPATQLRANSPSAGLHSYSQ